MPYLSMYRSVEEIAEISDLRICGDARIRLIDGEWAWCPVTELIRLGLLMAEEPAPEAGERGA